MAKHMAKPDPRKRRRVATLLLVGAITLLMGVVVGMNPTSVGAQTPGSTTTTTTTPAQLPTTMNGTMPKTGQNSGRMAGLALSSVLIGIGLLSFAQARALNRKFARVTSS